MYVVPQKLIAQALEVPASDVRIRPRARLAHQSNNLYDAWIGTRHLVIKEYLKPNEMEEAARREGDAMRLLAPLDIAPRLVLHHGSSADFGPFVAYDWMDGEMWDRSCPKSAELRQLADLWLTLHDLPKEKLWMSEGRSMEEAERDFMNRIRLYSDWSEQHYPAARPAIRLVYRILERRHEVAVELGKLTPVLCFCRGDARFANVIRRTSGQLGLVDWEDCGLRDPAREIADLLTAANQEDLVSWDEWQAFMQPYLAGRQASDPELERRLELYMTIFPIFWLVILVSHGVHRAHKGQLADWTINEMPPNQRLRRYLARALSWPKNEFVGELEALADVTFFPEV